MSSVTAISYFFSEYKSTLTGQAVNVVLVEEGTPNLSLIRHLNIEFCTKIDMKNNQHANKIAALIASQDLGIAPNINLFCLNHTVIYENKFYDTMQRIVQDYGKVDISVHAYSGIPSPKLSELSEASFRKCQLNKDTQHLMIAAAGHDGLGVVRYPACLPYVLAVGVSQGDRRCYFSGHNSNIRKPELLVENNTYITYENGDHLSSINGASAGVAVSSGIAALWAEKLKKNGYSVTPSLLKAILLASANPSCDEDVFLLSEQAPLTQENNCNLLIQKLDILSNGWSRVDVYIPKSGTVSCTFAADQISMIAAQFTVQPKISVCITVNDKLEIKRGLGWINAKLSVKQGDNVNIIISSDYNIQGFLVMTNATLKEKKIIRRKKAVADLCILGVSASHDASACIIDNSQLKTAIQLERITRLKRDGQGFLNSNLTGQYCLNSLGIEAQDVHYFAYNNQPLIPDYVGLSMPTHDEHFSLFNPFATNAFFVSHHLSHAYSAFFCSPFDEAVVLVADGSGGSVHNRDDLILPGNELKKYLHQKIESRPPVHVLSCYLFTRNKVELIYREYADSFNVRCGSKSLGETYAAVSQYIFGSWHDSGKLMGLAPYGNAQEYGESLLEEDTNGLHHFGSNWKNEHRNTSKKDVMHNKHLAARIQKDFELALLQRIHLIRKKTKLKNLCYTGGLALNSAANEKIIAAKLFEHTYFFPASSDAGISIGAAAAVNHHLTNSLKRKIVSHMFLGHPYHEQDYHFAIQKYLNYIHYEIVTPSVIAQYIAEGQIFGLFQGACEFGPRALGHRSIIADPRNRSVWQFINKRIKYREDFRPFAPAVIQEAASQFFEIHGESPYMLRIVDVKDEYKSLLQAVTHVNGTARIQTVDRHSNPLLYKILNSFGEITNYPILVNTSFNMGGQPIVEKPEEAIEMLLCTHLDGVIFENILVRPNRVKNCTSSDQRLLLAPDLKLCSESTKDDHYYFLSSKYQGRGRINLTQRQYEIINSINTNQPPCELGLIEEESNWLNSMCILNFIYQQREVQQHESN
jgi:carbamoyltransferase